MAETIALARNKPRLLGVLGGVPSEGEDDDLALEVMVSAP